MNSVSSRKPKVPPRIKLTDQIKERFTDRVFNRSVGDIVKRTGLPYMLVYNVVHRRVKSISQRNFRLIFQEEPPLQTPRKVDGRTFRNMVRLWLYLEGEHTKKELYHDLYPERMAKKPDFRTFTGRVATVDATVEQKMLRRFQANGLEAEEVFRWIDEMMAAPLDERIPYSRIRPHLLFLKEKIGIHPNAVLNQLFDRYENGDLRSVPRHVHERARVLRKKAEAALEQGTRLALESVKEAVYGSRAGYTLYSEISSEMKFLRDYARKSPKKYLGRSIGVYEKGLCKRLPSSKAAVIRRDCAAFIREHPELPLSALPRRYQREKVIPLIGVLIHRTTDMMIQDKGIELEKRILAPVSVKDAYKNESLGFTRFDLAAGVLGMRKRAFDLMVAKNCQIFRDVGRFDRHWYLSDLYLQELSRKPDFPLLTAKYELLSRKLKDNGTGNDCMN